MRVVAAREPRKVELFGIKIHLKPMAVRLLAFLILFHILISTLPATLLHFNKNSYQHRLPKVAPDCRLRELRHSLSSWRCMARSPMKRFWLGILDGPFATIFGCDRKFGILFWLLQKKPFGSWLHHQAISRYL